MINKNLIEKSQMEWGNGIIEIGKLKQNRLKCEEYTKSFLYRMYDFNNSKEILFKPTKAKIIQFRSSFEKALSYFIGGKNAACSEDKGFALEPWSKVKFENSGFIIEDSRAIVMGNYFFTKEDGSLVKVEYTFSYVLRGSKLFIDVHHSSLPFSN